MALYMIGGNYFKSMGVTPGMFKKTIDALKS